MRPKLQLRLLLAAVAAVVLTGCVGANVDDEPVEDADASVDLPAAAGGVATDVLDGVIEAAAATPVLSFNYGGTFQFEITPTEDVAGYVLELEWDATAPVNEELDLWVRVASEGNIPPSDPTNPVPGGPVVQATGGSVLKLPVPADLLEPGVTYSVLVRAASPAGVAGQQPFTLHVSTFEGVAFDEAYSALES